jgi:hypothetical protein
MLEPAKYSWRCTLCDADGFGGAAGYAVHYRVWHTEPNRTYTGFLIEARNEHGLKGTAAYEWAHSAYSEYVKNQA